MHYLINEQVEKSDMFHNYAPWRRLEAINALVEKSDILHNYYKIQIICSEDFNALSH